MAGRSAAAPSRRGRAAPDEPPLLNEHQSISLGYRRLLAHTWSPARVAAAAVQQHGPDALTPLYKAMARRIFAGADHYRVIREDLESVIVDALFEVGLNGAGTPIIHLGAAAFLGP